MTQKTFTQVLIVRCRVAPPSPLSSLRSLHLQGGRDGDGGPRRRRAGRGNGLVLAAPPVAAGAAARRQDADEAAALPPRQALRTGAL